MNLSDLYVLVDINNKEIIDKFQTLPKNWKNISCISSLSDEKLENLAWAGHSNIGWINIYSPRIKHFTSSVENLDLNKNTLKEFVSKKRKEEQSDPIEYKGGKFKTDLKTRYSLSLLINSKKPKIEFKCINGYYTFTQSEILEIYNLIENKIEKLFELESKIYNTIEKCKSFQELLKIKI